MYYRGERDTLEQSAGNRMTEKLLHGRTLLHTDAIANISFLHTQTIHRHLPYLNYPPSPLKIISKIIFRGLIVSSVVIRNNPL